MKSIYQYRNGGYKLKLDTTNFGEIEYDAEDIIIFESGIYGFEEEKEFLYVQSDDKEFQFNWLQSTKTPDLTFIVTVPFIFVENYDFDLDEQMVEKMSIDSSEDMTILSIVNVDKEVEKTTINIKAPLIVNNGTREGKQVILKEDYQYKYYIFSKELNEG